MALDKKLFKPVEEAAAADTGTGNQEEGLVLYLDANDDDSYDGDGSIWYDITDHEYTPATDVSEHFNTVTYSGNSSTQSITGVGFAPDLIWVKNRTNANSHNVFDSLRGAYKVIYTNLVNDEDTRYNSLTAFDTDGFSLGNYVGVNGSYNYVAWCFKAGGAPSGSDKVSIDGTSYSTMTAAGLTDGTEPITKLSVNTELGFSIVTYTAPALRVDTVAHGLGEAPEMIIQKNIESDRNWNVFHKDVGTSKNLHLNAGDAANTSEDWTANSTTFSIQDQSASADRVAYCFTSKRGVSKVGSYTGSTGSVKVYTGFEPAFVMIKNADVSGDPHVIFDNKRGENGEYDYLYPNEAYTEGAGDSTLNSGRTGITFNRDGFTLDDDDSHSVNEPNKKHIYLAFAKNTKETSLIDDTDLVMHLDAGNDDSYNGSGTTWSDLANSNDATISGASWDKELGNWFNFDGTNDELTFSSSTALTTRTIEFWFRTPSLTANNPWWIMDSMPQYAGTNSFGVWSVYADSTHIYFIGAKWNGSTYGGYRGTNTMKEDKWHHIAFSCENGSYKGYIDGELIEDTNHSAYVTTRNIDSVTLSNVNFMGMRSGYTGGTYYAEGKLGQIRIYDSVLSQSQIRQNYNFTKNDYPNGHDGDFVNLVPSDWNSTGYFNFSGSNEYVDITGGNYFSSSTVQNDNIKAFTGWVRLPSDNTRAILYSASSSSNGNDYFSLVVRRGSSYKVYINARNGSVSNYYIDNVDYTVDSNWHHYVFQLNGDEREIYVDGVKKTITEDNVGSATSSSWRSYVSYDSSTVHAIQLGRKSSPFYGKGYISKLKFYNRALTQTEITALYNEGE